MQVFLIRHAQSKGNELNTVQGHSCQGLSETGKKQVEKLKDYFNPGDISAIYSSDTERAIQTAEPIAKKLNLKIETDPNLREANFGIWEGMTYSDVHKKYLKEYTDWHKNSFVRPPWFESFEKHQERARRGIEKILEKHDLNDKVAIVTHGGSIKTQIGFFNKLTGEELANFSLANCSLTLINFNPSKHYENGKIVYYNKEVI